MKWLDRVKKAQTAPTVELTELTKGAFVGFVSAEVAPIPDFEAPTVNDPEFSPDPDRWCWPHSDAMTGAEIDRMLARQALFSSRGLRVADAEWLADRLVRRDRDLDDRRICLECTNLRGRNCAVPAVAGAGVVVQALARLPQRCAGFEGAV